MRYIVINEKLSSIEESWFRRIKWMESEVRSGKSITMSDLSELVDKGVNVNVKNEIEDTAITLGFGWAPISYYSSLLKWGANPNQVDSSGIFGLNYFITSNDISCFKLFISSGANINFKERTDSRFPLLVASRYGRYDFVKELLKHDRLDLDNRDIFNNTALHEASENKHLNIVKLLLSHGANPLIRDIDNRIPRDLTTDNKIKTLLREYEIKYLTTPNEEGEI